MQLNLRRYGSVEEVDEVIEEVNPPINRGGFNL
jgi:hypothetical protein